jgi:hypothetical protein
MSTYQMFSLVLDIALGGCALSIARDTQRLAIGTQKLVEIQQKRLDEHHDRIAKLEGA